MYVLKNVLITIAILHACKICDIVDSKIRNTVGGETIMSDEEFLANYNSDTATKEEELRLINILLNMPDEDY